MKNKNASPGDPSDGSVEAEFARFQSVGDLAALGRAFDSVAPELLAVARHLLGSGPEAEDIVQETFLTAIERAPRYDASRPLVPWLTGILTRHAKRERRLRVRTPDAERLASAGSVDPEGEAQRGELRGLVEQHVAKLPSSYAAAVRSHLLEGLAPRDIASQLGITANAASVRLHRGLARLRKSLPAGIAFGAVLGLRPERGLGALRESVLGQAVGSGSKAAMATGLGFGQVAAVVAGLTAAAGAGWWAAGRDGGQEDHREERAVAVAPVVEAPKEVELEPARRVAIDPGAPVEHAARKNGRALDAAIPSERTPSDWLARFNGAESWRDGITIGQEIAELPPDEGLAILREIYHAIEKTELRQQLLKPFVFHGGHPKAVDILHLAATDPEMEVQSWAFGYLEPYALRDFASDYAAYEDWHARTADRPLADVLRTSARDACERLATLSSDEVARELARIDKADPRIGRAAGVDVLGLYAEVGLMDQVAGWIADPNPQLVDAALDWVGELPLERDYLERHVLPRFEREGADKEVLLHGVCRLLGRAGNDWAAPVLLDMLEDEQVDTHSHVSVYSALGDIGDPSVLPALIAAFVESDDPQERYHVGHFALADLTGVSWDESQDAAFWLAWWDANQNRLPVELRGTQLPLGGS